MLSTVLSVYSLLLAIGILLLGSGLLGTLVSLRAAIAGYSNTVIGIIMSAFFIGYIIGAYLCPRLIRDVGHIRAFSALAAVAAAAMIIHGLIINPYVWWLLRIITGICIIGLYMVVESWLNSLIKTHQQRGRIFSIYIMTTLVALGLGQFLLLIYGPTEMASFALGALFFSMALVPIAITRLSQPPKVAVPHLRLRKMARISPLGTFGAFCSGLTSGALWGLGPLYAQGLGYGNTGIALFISAIILGGVLLQFPIGHQSDLHDRRKVLTLVAIAGACTALVMYFVATYSNTLFYALVILYGGFSFTIYALCVSHTNDHIQPEEVMEATRTLLLLNGIGAAIGPIMGGILMQLAGNQVLMLYFASVLGTLSLFAVYRLRVGIPIPMEQQDTFIPMTRTGTEVVELDPRSNNIEHQE